MTNFRLKQFSVYDDTDALKRMKDSDILSEKRKQSLSTGNIARMTVAGAAGLGAVGAIGNSVLRKSNGYFRGMGGRLVKGGKAGALVGAAAGIGGGLLIKNRQEKNNAFYNDRLAYAQEQAKRREKKDWKNNMTNREGYSY